MWSKLRQIVRDLNVEMESAAMTRSWNTCAGEREERQALADALERAGKAIHPERRGAYPDGWTDGRQA